MMKFNFTQAVAWVSAAAILTGCALVPEFDTPISEKHVEQKEKAQKQLKEQKEREQKESQDAGQ